MARFYGWNHNEIEGMNVIDLFAYAEAINALRSDEHFLNIECSSYPHMDKKGKTNVVKRHKKIQSPLRKEKITSFDDLEVKLV